jgi:hypothetical protein
VELVEGFRLLGHPVGSAKFASDYFTKCTTTVQNCIKLLSDSISDQQTKLRLFSMCLIQKIPHLLSSDVMHHLPLDDADPPWEEWCGPLTQTTDKIIQDFLSTLLDVEPIPEYATILLSQLGLSAGSLGILCPRLRAAPDFVITMTSVCRRATRFHKTLLPHHIHPTIDTNPDSLFLQRLHCLLPHIAKIGSAPTIPDESRINAFLNSTSPKSARDRINKYCTAYLHGATHQEFATNAREHMHLLPGILSPQTSYPLIGMCRSVASHRLPPWIFTICMKRKLRLPILDDAPGRKCACGRQPDKFGDHAFQCTRICKIGVHNNIRNGLPLVLPPDIYSPLPNSRSNQCSTSHLIPTHVRSIFRSTRNLRSRRSSRTLALTPPSAPTSPSSILPHAHPSILTHQMLYDLHRPTPIRISRSSKSGN